MDADFGGPQWVFGQSHHACLSDGRIAAIGRSRGRDRLYLVAEGRDPEEVDTPYTELSGLVAAGNRVAFVGAGPLTPSAVAMLDLGTGALEEVRRTGDLPVDAAYLSEPRWVEFPTDGGQSAFAYLYEPVNPDAAAPPGERPPLLVFVHGGPTSSSGSAFNPDAQFFASRGFAVVDVDYGGSTGYGRAYRERLNGNWGIVDLADCTAAAPLAGGRRGLVDGGRMAIRGGSAGGYTTLCALCFRDIFAAGTSLTASATWRRWCTTRTSSSRGTSTNWWPHTRRTCPSTGTAHPSTSSIGSRLRCLCSRGARIAWCRGPRRTTWWPRWPATAFPTPTSCSKAKGTASGGPRTSGVL